MTNYKNFKISAKFQGFEVNKAWREDQPRKKFFVYVTNTDTGAKTRFTFWDCIAISQKDPKDLGEYGTLNAFIVSCLML